MKRIALVFTVFVFSWHTFAGGPLNLGGSNNNIPVTYGNGGAVSIHLDQGPLGNRTNAEVSALVMQAISLWNNVGTSTLVLSRGADLEIDVDHTNFTQYLNCFPCFSDGINPIVYDTDGKLTDELLGSGMSNRVLGFASSAFFRSTAKYAEGRAVINGKINSSNTRLMLVIAHELGHFFGLDHTQIDNTQGVPDRPVMYPIAGRSSQTLHEDDIISLTELYPANALEEVYGEIIGRFIEADGITPVLGANLWVQSLTENLFTTSKVSDYLTEGSGYFRLLVEPGIYALYAESIQNNFTGGSSVGPYSEAASEPSFQPPHPIAKTALGGNGSPVNIAVSVGCVAEVEFQLDGGGALVSTNCEEPPIEDTTPPVVNAPGNLVVNATGELTPVNLGVATATDNIDGELPVQNNAPELFPLGTTIVTYTATDAAGNVGTASQSVTVTDNTPPEVSAPSDLVVDATGELTAVSLGEASATDNVGGELPVQNDAPELFPLGTTIVTYTATDGAGNVGTATQSVTVKDDTPPVLHVPADRTYSTWFTPVVILFRDEATAEDVFPVTITDDAPYLFYEGTTTITFTATDAAGNVTTGTQRITVIQR